MASIESTIVYITYFICVYIGYFIVITGLIGNIMNILVFTQLKLFRKNQSAFYLTVASIVDCCELIFTTATRVTTNAFGCDPTQTSIIWCKLRTYVAEFGDITSTITVCFAAFDQYLSTSHDNQLRQMSTFKLAQRLVGVLIIYAALYSISFPIFYEIRSTSGCSIYNPVFNYYYSFIHFCIVLGLLPVIISSLFSLLAYQNVRRVVRHQIPIVRRRLDRQLTAMILLRVALLVLTTLPFVSFKMYQINDPVNQNNSLATAIVQLIRMIILTIYDTNYAGSFYVFMLSSARFRRQVKYLCSKKIWRKCLAKNVNRNQIAPQTAMQRIGSQVSSIEIDSRDALN